MKAVVNQECEDMPDPMAPPFSGRNNQTELLSFVNMTGVSSANLTDLE